MTQEAILNCLICNHEFDWNQHQHCPNCHWEIKDFVGDIEHTAVLLRSEREAWIAKKNYKITDFSYKGYIPALLEAMKNQFNFEDFNENYKITAFYREWCEDDADFNTRISQKPVKLGVAGWIPKKYNPKTGDFPILIQWDKRITDSRQADSEDKRYFVNIPKDQAKKVFESNATPPIYLHLNFDDLKQIHAINAYLVANNQVFEIKPLDHIELLEIQGDEENNLPDCTLDLKANKNIEDLSKNLVNVLSNLKSQKDHKPFIIDVKIPQFSESVSEGTLLEWHVKIGQYVEEGTNLVDIETDKIVLELPAVKSGVITEIIKANGDTVVSEEVVAKIATN